LYLFYITSYFIFVQLNAGIELSSLAFLGNSNSNCFIAFLYDLFSRTHVLHALHCTCCVTSIFDGIKYLFFAAILFASLLTRYNENNVANIIIDNDMNIVPPTVSLCIVYEEFSIITNSFFRHVIDLFSKMLLVIRCANCKLFV
jgi:hypothetical protein